MRGPTTPVLIAVALLVLVAPSAALARTQVSGTVTGEGGTPATDAELTLVPVGDGGQPVSTTTNRKGGFLLTPVPAGEYRVSVRVEGLAVRDVAATAVNADNTPAWTIEAGSAEGADSVLRIEEGMRITCDVKLGAAFSLTAPDGTKTTMAPAEALDELTRQVQSGNCAGALGDLVRFAEYSPDVAKTHYLTGFCQASLGKNDEAVTSLDRALALQPSFPGAPLLRGQVLARMGRNEEAESSLKQEIDLAANPQLVLGAWIALGVLYRDVDRNSDAVEAFRNVTRLAPDRAESYAELATLHVKLKDLASASAVLEEAKKRGALPPQAALNLAIAYFEEKDYDAAARALESVIAAGRSSREDLGTAYALLGRCQIKQERNDRAVTSLEKSLSLDPGGKLAAESRTLLDSLRGK